MEMNNVFFFEVIIYIWDVNDCYEACFFMKK